MSDIRLTTPEGYFEESYERTVNAVSVIKRRRKTVLGCCAVALLVSGLVCTGVAVKNAVSEQDYYAMEAEMAQLDIFMEINR